MFIIKRLHLDFKYNSIASWMQLERKVNRKLGNVENINVHKCNT